MKILTDTLLKEHCKLYTEIHGLIALNSRQIELAKEQHFTIKYRCDIL